MVDIEASTINQSSPPLLYIKLYQKEKEEETELNTENEDGEKNGEQTEDKNKKRKLWNKAGTERGKKTNLHKKIARWDIFLWYCGIVLCM